MNGNSVEGMTPVVRFVANDSKLEPSVTDVRTRTIVIKDGKGGQCCFDISEVGDLALELASLAKTDAPGIRVVDLTNRTSE